MPDVAEAVEWVAADGTTTALSVDWDAFGRFMPPIRRNEETVPLQPGARLRDAVHDVREVLLTLILTGVDESALRASLRSLTATFDPSRGDGKLRVTAPDSVQRELTCRYSGGLELSERLGDDSGPGWQEVPALFRAVDPYWYDTSSTVQTFTSGTPQTFFPIFPIRLSSSTVFSSTAVDNTGDVAAWPVWTITGPGTNLVLRNLTTGKTLAMTYTLAAGQTITVDTRPGAKTVTLNTGANLYQYLTSPPHLWSLRRGSNTVQVELSSVTSASSVALSYKRGFLTP